jgi:hypothetical protein
MAFLDNTAFTIGNVGVTWAYIIASVLVAAVLAQWAWLHLLGNAALCPGCKRTWETCSCVDIQLTPFPYLVYDPASMTVVGEHETEDEAWVQADLLNQSGQRVEVLLVDE